MLPGLSPRSASRTGSNLRPLERALTFANSFPYAIGEEEVKEEADEPALEEPAPERPIPAYSMPLSLGCGLGPPGRGAIFVNGAGLAPIAAA